MKKLLIILSVALMSCTDNKKIIKQSILMHADSARNDSSLFEQKRQENEKNNGIIRNGKFYSNAQLDSVFAGQK